MSRLCSGAPRTFLLREPAVPGAQGACRKYTAEFGAKISLHCIKAIQSSLVENYCILSMF